MSSVFVDTMMSLDGFIADPDEGLHRPGDIPAGLVDEVARTGALLGGRRVYEVGRRAERPEMRGLFGGCWSGPQFILTHTPPTDEPDPPYTFLSGDVRGGRRDRICGGRRA